MSSPGYPLAKPQNTVHCLGSVVDMIILIGHDGQYGIWKFFFLFILTYTFHIHISCVKCNTKDFTIRIFINNDAFRNVTL